MSPTVVGGASWWPGHGSAPWALQRAELTSLDPQEYLVVAGVVLLGLFLAALLVAAADFSSVDRPGRARVLLGTWLVGLVAALGVALFDRFHRAVRLVDATGVRVVPQVNFPNVLLVLAAFVLAAGIVFDVELR